MPEKYYTIREAAKKLNVSYSCLYQRIRAGIIGASVTSGPGRKKIVRVSESDIYEYVQQRDIGHKLVLLKNSEHKLYIMEKLEILKDLRIVVTDAQAKYMASRKTEYEIDAFYHDLIMGKAKIK